jgi:hypothetical protein
MSNKRLKTRNGITWGHLIIFGILTMGIVPLRSLGQSYSLKGAKVQLIGGEVFKGTLIRMTSDSIIVELKDGRRKSVHYQSVDHMKMHRSGGVENGVLIGAGAGLVVGVVAGIAANTEDSNASSNCYYCNVNPVDPALVVAGAGFLGALVGASIGAIFSSQPSKILIQGDRMKYEDLRTKCLMSFWKQAENDKKKR